jgi:hypothetical protein
MQTEQKHLQEAITYHNNRGFCAKHLVDRLQEISPKIPTKHDLAKAGRDNYGEEMRLLKMQEAQIGSLRTKIANCEAKAILIRDQQLANVAEEVDRHHKAVEALNNDASKILEFNLKAAAEAETKLQETEAKYAVDFKRLNDARKATPATAEPTPIQLLTVTKPAPPVAPKVTFTPMLATADSMQAHMQASGVTSPEQLAQVPMMVAMFNAMIAAQLAPAPIPSDVSAITQDADANGTEAQAKEKEQEEQRLAVEAAQLNGEGAVASYSAGKPAKHSDRVNPMSA